MKRPRIPAAASPADGAGPASSSLGGQVAIVTGGGGGIGTAIARTLALAGATVVVTYVTKAHGDEASREIRDAGGTVIARRCDVTDAVDVARVARETVTSLGRIDILVNNAGGTAAAAPAGAIDEVSEADWDRVVALNLKGAFLCSRAVLPHMRRAGRGTIVNVSSSVARRGAVSMPGRVAYNCAKAGLEGLTRTLASEEGRHGIRVNAVAPGPTVSSDRVRRMFETLDPARRGLALELIPLGRFATPGDVAGVVRFLVSEEAGYITGVTVDVDGGPPALTWHHREPRRSGPTRPSRTRRGGRS